MALEGRKVFVKGRGAPKKSGDTLVNSRVGRTEGRRQASCTSGGPQYASANERCLQSRSLRH